MKTENMKIDDYTIVLRKEVFYTFLLQGYIDTKKTIHSTHKGYRNNIM